MTHLGTPHHIELTLSTPQPLRKLQTELRPKPKSKHAAANAAEPEVDSSSAEDALAQELINGEASLLRAVKRWAPTNASERTLWAALWDPPPHHQTGCWMTPSLP